jgi:hypothetical protein
MNFIKKVFDGVVDESIHAQFIRFGKGNYGRRGLLSLWKTKLVKIKGSFEFANDFTSFVASLDEMVFSGNIWSKEKLEGLSGKKKGEKWTYEVENFSSEDLKKIKNQVYYFLLDGEGEGIKLKIKKKLPKPGKSENKIDDKFCQMELDEKYYGKAKEEFFWDLPNGKKISVEHNFVIESIVPPKDEKDFAKIRELAKRKGKIIRKSNVDGEESVKEIEFEA